MNKLLYIQGEITAAAEMLYREFHSEQLIQHEIPTNVQETLRKKKNENRNKKP
jgi:hypothetical protein